MIASKEKKNSLKQRRTNLYNKKGNSGNKFRKKKKISNTNKHKNKTIKQKIKTNETFVNNKKQKNAKKRKHKEQDDWSFIKQEAQWGDQCNEIEDNDEDTLRIYCQNVNGIYDGEGLGLEEAFHTMRTVKAGIFTFNETHGDNTNPEARKI